MKNLIGSRIGPKVFKADKRESAYQLGLRFQDDISLLIGKV